MYAKTLQPCDDPQRASPRSDRPCVQGLGGWLARCLLIGLSVFLSFLASADKLPAQTPPAAAEPVIRVVGNQRVDPDTIRSYLRTARGQALDAAALDAAIKGLYATQLFEDVRIDHSGGQLVVTVRENPLIKRLAFEGNRKLKDDALKKEIQSTAGGPLWRPLVQQDVERIVEAYRRIGYFDVSVDPQTINATDRQAELVFEIKEGKKVGIGQIVFVGNKAYGADRLKGEIKIGTTNFLSFLLQNDVYDPDLIAVDQDRLRDFYLKHGYADIRVAVASQFDPAQKAFTVTFTVDEGSQYRFGTVDIASTVPGLNAQDLRQYLRSDAGSVFNAEAVEKSVEALSIESARRGFPFASVHPTDNRDAARHIINLVYAVEQGPRTYVERINIRGNSKTRDAVIRRELDFGEGDAYNRVLIDRAERRLKSLGFFKTVKITQVPGSTPDRVDVNIDVEEQGTGNFSIAVGYSLVDGVEADIGIGDTNMLGTGNGFKASVTYGQYIKGFDLAFTEPYILDTRTSLGEELFGKETLASSYQSYGTDTYGATIKVGAPLTDDIGTQWRYSLYNQSVSLDPSLINCSPSNPPAGGCASIPIQQAALSGPAWVSSIGTTVTYSTLDNVKNPTNGFNLALNQDLAGIGGDVDFFKTTADLRYYHEIADGWVGMVRAQGGYITPWGGQQLPLMDGFFGGPQLVRGFAPNGFGPRDLTPGTTMDNLGGTQYFATTAELDAPVPIIPQSSGLKFGIFADAGSIWGYGGAGSTPALAQSLQVANSNVIRSSLGAGLIWDSPFGPIRADYAIPLTKASYDVTQRFSFTAGGFY